MYDFNDAPEQRDFGDLIPKGTIARVKMEVRYPSSGDAGDLPELTRSTTSDAQFLDCEFTVLSEPMMNRKLWMNIMFKGVSEKAMNISKGLFRAILESSRGIRPDDFSELAHKARRINSLSDFNEIEFAARIGIEEGKDGYEDKNKIAAALTPDKPEYQTVMSGHTVVGKSAAKPATKSSAPPSNPAWDQSGPAANQQQATKQPQNEPAASSAPDPVPDWAK